MATTLTIGGVAINPARYPIGPLVAYSKGGVPSLTVSRRGGKLPGLPDPWVGKEAVLQVTGTTYFRGDVETGPQPEYADGLGWVLAYRALGLEGRADKVPVTDDNTGLDTCGFNLDENDPSYIASRAGRTVGQVLSDVLTMVTNSANLSLYGLGA